METSPTVLVNLEFEIEGEEDAQGIKLLALTDMCTFIEKSGLPVKVWTGVLHFHDPLGGNRNAIRAK
jgi:hypothetical protein